MTVEHRYVVGLGDIRAVTLECKTKTCRARVTVSTDKIETLLIGDRNCPACGCRWFSPSTAIVENRTMGVVKFLAALKAAQESEHEDAVGARVLLEFNEPSLPPPPTAK